MPPGRTKCPQTSCSFVLALFPSLFQLSWFEVLSGATVLSVTVTSLNYHVQTSTQHLDRQTVNLPHRSSNQENELTCNSIFQPPKLSSASPLSPHEKPPWHKVSLHIQQDETRKETLHYSEDTWFLRSEKKLCWQMRWFLVFNTVSVVERVLIFSWTPLNLKIYVD